MKKIGFTSVVLILSIFLLSFQCAAVQDVQHEFINKIEELADKLTSSVLEKAGIGVIAVPGIDLKSVFSRLENAGFAPGHYNEEDLSKLSESIKRFQKFAKIKESGILDSGTWAKLQMLYDPKMTSGKKSVTSDTPKVSKILVIEFTHEDKFNDLTKKVYEDLSDYFVKKGIQLVESAELDKTIKEQNISYPGLINTAQAQKLGKALNSEVVLSGIIKATEDTITISAQMTDVEKGIVLSDAEVELKKTSDVEKMMQVKGKKDLQICKILRKAGEKDSKSMTDNENLIKNTINILNNMADILATVKDSVSAKIADPELASLCKQYKEFEKFEKLEPSDEVKAIFFKYIKEFKAAFGKFDSELNRVTNTFNINKDLKMFMKVWETTSVNRSYNSAANADIKNAYVAAQAYFTDFPKGKVTLETLKNKSILTEY